MTLFTKQEKQVAYFILVTLIAGYSIKLYNQKHMYDGFDPGSENDKDSFRKMASLAYSTGKIDEGPQTDNPETKSEEKNYKQIVEIININTAGKQDLLKLPKVGPVTTERIIRFRDDIGSFTTLEDLLKVKGIGPKTLENLRPLIKL